MRLAFSLLSILPGGAPTVDRRGARRAMLAAPLVGVLLGVLAGGAGALARTAGSGDLVAAVLAVGALAWLTRGLHLDGLADTADGLGSGRQAPEALDVMKRSDIGPFGVFTLVLVLVLDIAALRELYDVGPVHGAAGVILAAAAGRCAVTLACRHGVPSARPGGLGSLVAGSVPTGAAAAVAGAVLAGAAGLGFVGWFGAGSAGFAALHASAAVAAGLVAAAMLQRRCVARLGGVTGDVFGALVETGQAVALLVLCLG
ncbi:MAG: adenosylcobinamide-GDP ribazoletransferase [Actinomycetota bacterium]|nr:adenosylcobinamide-GDP ribazoletransferase [Actinomycetota bacterium]